MGKWFRVVLICIALLMLLGGCTKTAIIGGTEYPLDSTSLDLSGTPLTEPEILTQFTQLQQLNLRNTGLTGGQYDVLKQALPGCEILWTPTFQGQSYDPSTTSLTLKTALTEADIAQLAYFPDLTHLDASACRDYVQLKALLERYPGLSVDYAVYLGGQSAARDAKAATFPDLTAEELEAVLYLLPELENLVITGELPALEDISRLQESYPDVTIGWAVTVCGVTVRENVTELDLSGITVESVEEVESKLGYLPALQKVIMCDCGISNEEMDALNRRHENILFVWNVTLGPYITVRTDITEFIVYKYRYKYYLDDEAAYNLRYCTEMICLDLGHNDVTKCDFLAYMPKLKYLVIADTDIADLTPLTGLTNLVYLEAFLCPITDFTPLATLTALEDLNIGYTECKDYTPLMQMTWLKRLWWSRSRLTGEERAPLKEALPDTEIVFNQSSSTGGGWRRSQNYYDMRDMLGMHYMSG